MKSLVRRKLSLNRPLIYLACLALGLPSCLRKKLSEAQIKEFEKKQFIGKYVMHDKTLSLTLDDGPGPRAAELGEFLQERGIRATFFVVGKVAKKNKAILEKLVSQGHLIASHTYTHLAMPDVVFESGNTPSPTVTPALTKTPLIGPNTTTLGPSPTPNPTKTPYVLATVQNQELFDCTILEKQIHPVEPFFELYCTDKIIAPFVEDDMFMFRAPTGKWSATLSTYMNTTSLRKYIGSIYWDIGGALTYGFKDSPVKLPDDGIVPSEGPEAKQFFAADWSCWLPHIKLTVEQCAQGYLNEIRTKRKGIILAHDIHHKSIDMLMKIVIPTLIEEGYQFVRLDELSNIAAALEKTKLETARRNPSPSPSPSNDHSTANSAPTPMVIDAIPSRPMVSDATVETLVPPLDVVLDEINGNQER